MKTRKAKRITSPGWKDGTMLLHETSLRGVSNILKSNELQAATVSGKTGFGYEEEPLSSIFMTLWVSPMKFKKSSDPILIFRTNDILPVYGGAMNAHWYGEIRANSKHFHSMKDIPSWIEFSKLHQTKLRYPEVIVKTDRIPLSKLYGIYLGYIDKDSDDIHIKLINEYPSIHWIYKLL